MFGGSSKLGGGGGRGGPASKRASFPPLPPPNRPTSRLSLSGGFSNNNRPGAAAAAGGGGVDETFSLVPGRNSNSFAVIVKLVPGLVEELRKVKEGGGAARIKFDHSEVGPSGNVIDVGGKEFKFTWASENAELCDIFEEQQSGEDGNGLLLQSGSCCRKMNVQRTLDESTTNHVKMRTVEAERKHKSRKAIVLDHGSPSMKSQLKQMAAAESSPWKLFNQKKTPPLKKQKVDAPQAPASTKSIFNSTPASTVAKGRKSSSPLPSPPQQSVPVSSRGTGSIAKSPHSTERIMVGQTKSKESAVSAEKELQGRVSPVVRATSGHKVSPSVDKGNSHVNQMDLESMLILQLKENPKGMSLKALEKAIGNIFSNSATKLEPILKKIATSQGPGRYSLKPGVNLESIRKLPSESGSSPDGNRQHELVPQDRHDRDALDVKSGEINIALQSEGQADSNVLEELTMLRKNDVQHQPPDLFGDKKDADKSEGPAGSSSDSGSKSDSGSESSDSEAVSGSRSPSRSKSPVASGSGSSSESESDVSSNSKEGSDEDVDIMTSDDDKEGQQNLPISGPALSGSPDVWRSAHATDEREDVDVFAGARIEGHVSDNVEIGGHESDAFEADKGLIGEDSDIDMDESRVHNIEAEVPGELDDGNTMQDRETLIGKLFGSNENISGESFRHELPDPSEKKPKAKSKRGPETNYDEKPERVKIGKTESLVTDHGSGGKQLSDSRHDMQIDNNSKGPMIQVNQADQEGNIHFGSQKTYNQTVSKKGDSEIQQSGKGSSDPNMHKKGNEKSRRSKHDESSGRGRKSSGKGSQIHEDSHIHKGKSSADPELVKNFPAEKKMPKKARENSLGGRKSAPLDSHYKKQDEMLEKPIDAVPALNAHTGSSPAGSYKSEIEKVPLVNGKTLQREFSDLEQGELREIFEETPVKTNMADLCRPGLSKGKPIGKKASNTRKPSPNFSADFKNAADHNENNIPRSRNKVARSMPQQFPRVEDIEVGSQSNQLAESSGKLRQNGTGIKQGNGSDGQGDGFKKALVGVQQPLDLKRGLSHSTKESKTQPPKKINNLVDGRKYTLSEGNNSAPRKWESSSEEDSYSYSKYDKEVPELKGPIKDFSTYKEYVQEYREKYESYCTLNKSLENYRNEFQNLGKDLESVKGKDMERYHKILVQLKESYCRSGLTHKRLKKIFVVLHEELKNLKQRIKDFAASYT